MARQTWLSVLLLQLRHTRLINTLHNYAAQTNRLVASQVASGSACSRIPTANLTRTNFEQGQVGSYVNADRPNASRFLA